MRRTTAAITLSFLCCSALGQPAGNHAFLRLPQNATETYQDFKRWEKIGEYKSNLDIEKNPKAAELVSIRLQRLLQEKWLPTPGYVRQHLIISDATETGAISTKADLALLRWNVDDTRFTLLATGYGTQRLYISNPTIQPRKEITDDVLAAYFIEEGTATSVSTEQYGSDLSYRIVPHANTTNLGMSRGIITSGTFSLIVLQRPFALRSDDLWFEHDRGETSNKPRRPQISITERSDFMADASDCPSAKEYIPYSHFPKESEITPIPDGPLSLAMQSLEQLEGRFFAREISAYSTNRSADFWKGKAFAFVDNQNRDGKIEDVFYARWTCNEWDALEATIFSASTHFYLFLAPNSKAAGPPLSPTQLVDSALTYLFLDQSRPNKRWYADGAPGKMDRKAKPAPAKFIYKQEGNCWSFKADPSPDNFLFHGIRGVVSNGYIYAYFYVGGSSMAAPADRYYERYIKLEY